MQRFAALEKTDVFNPFSILGRIGGDATGEGTGSGCVRFAPFQYPRSDRRRCNRLVGAIASLSVQAFSILGRIGGDATACSTVS